jgi:hypothetical protein
MNNNLSVMRREHFTDIYIYPHETGTRTTHNAHCHSKFLLNFDLVYYLNYG